MGTLIHVPNRLSRSARSKPLDLASVFKEEDPTSLQKIGITNFSRELLHHRSNFAASEELRAHLRAVLPRWE
jgi:hypothetical protein